MGVVLFQFQLSFSPTHANGSLLRHLRSCLHKDLHMAIEFRNRAWFTGHEGLPACVVKHMLPQ